MGGSRRLTLLATLALTSGMLVVLAIAFARPSNDEPRLLEVPLADVPAEEPLFVRPFDMGFSPDGAPYGVWLVRDVHARGGVLALWSAETYHPTRCAIVLLSPGDRNAYGAWFWDGSGRCPAARYDRDGRAVFRAPRGMDRFDLEVIDGVVRIDLSSLRLGDCSEHAEFELDCPYSKPDRPLYRRMHWPRS